MRPLLRLTILAAPAALLAAALPGGPAAAQQMVRPPPQQQAPVTAAPALPGLAARRTPAPIPADPTVSLSPNAALFDAISRGDLGAAREAVARGADIDTRNALGLTPLDAAVDQGRNEIAFYLLSARDVARGPGEAPQAAPPPVVRAPAPRREPPRALAAPPPATGPAVPRTAALWAGNGGAPQPEIGFLGFDAGRPHGAVPPTATPGARRGWRG
jgi:hypothetical protein